VLVFVFVFSLLRVTRSHSGAAGADADGLM
jgi:hypothetical protein